MKWNKELARLPQLIALWGLRDLKPVSNLSHNYVLSGFKDDEPVVLKISSNYSALALEAQALESFAGYGAARLLAKTDGSILLGKVLPGASLSIYFPDQDQEAAEIVCSVIKQLHKAPIKSRNIFPCINDWLKALDAENNEIEKSILAKARMLKNKLLATGSEEVLLHGDLHHDNILRSEDGWVVIDPKGVIGEPAYEVAAFIRNPLTLLFGTYKDPFKTRNIINERIKTFAELLDLDEQRIRDWCFVQGVLCWLWAIEDGCSADYFKRLILVSLLQN